MAEEDFDVIINDKQYKQLKENKNRVMNLEKKLSECRQSEDVKDLKIAKLEKEIQILKEQVNFLQGVVFNIGNQRIVDPKQEIIELEQSAKSGSYEVLGQSIMFPTKVNPRQSQLKSKDLIKKFSSLVEHSRIIQQKLESQEELIKQLNKLNAEKDELLLTKNLQKTFAIISEQLPTKITSFNELKEVVAEHKHLKLQAPTLEKQLKVKNEEAHKLKEEVQKLNQACKQKTIEIEKMKEEVKKAQQSEKAGEGDKLKEELRKTQLNLKQKANQCQKMKLESKKLSQMVASYAQKYKKVENDLKQIKRPNQKASSFGDRPYRIKLLIDEHIKQMENSLGSLGGLSSQEVKSMLEDELKGITEYIPKSLANKK